MCLSHLEVAVKYGAEHGPHAHLVGRRHAENTKVAEEARAELLSAPAGRGAGCDQGDVLDGPPVKLLPVVKPRKVLQKGPRNV
eukprot:scaffold423178_cov51-Prasinocladus_malaysianus.AAC.1